MAARKNADENSLLRAIRARVAVTGRSVRIGIGDDCAVLAARSGEEIVITTDFSIEDRHFRMDWHSPEAIGHKCIARGLSDIAAMGARPIAAFLSLALPLQLTVAKGERPSWMTRFYDGLLALAEREDVILAGGDLAQTPSLSVADIVVVGAVRKNGALLRSGARRGDILYVTGSLGGAAAELAAVQRNPKRFRGLVEATENHPHFFPQPRLAVGQALVRRKLATACIDVSDGLSVDLLHLCEESNLSAEIDAAALPIHPAAKLEQALHGGDDYELLFTANPAARIPHMLAGIAVHAIGRMLPRTSSSLITLLQSNAGKPSRTALMPRGWQHF